jgi:hypothetical protein
MLLTLPVNVIPILGQVVYVTLNGWVFTFAARFHYDVEIRYVSVLQSREEAWARRKEYTSFGSVAFGLQLIPLANLLFAWTNIVGAALWVADEIEKEELHLQRLQSSQSLMGNNHLERNNNNNDSHIVRPEPPRITPPMQQQPPPQQQYAIQQQQQHSQHGQYQHEDAPPTYTPGNHVIVAVDGVPQQSSRPFGQEQQQQFPSQNSFSQQGQSSSSSSNAFAQQGSPRIPPKN